MLPTRRKLAWVRSGRPVRRAELTSTNSFWDSIIGDASAWLLFFFSAGRGKREREEEEGERERERVFVERETEHLCLRQTLHKEGESRGEQKKSCRALISLLKDSPRGNPALAWRTASAKVCVLPGCNDVPMINQYSRDCCFLLSWRREYDDMCHDGYRSCYCPQPSEKRTLTSVHSSSTPSWVHVVLAIFGTVTSLVTNSLYVHLQEGI